MATLPNPDEFGRQTGAYVQPGVGMAYPDLVRDMRAIYRNKVAKLPFVPSGWLDQVERTMGTDTLVLLFQPLPYGKPTRNPLPDWIRNDPAATVAWQKAAEMVRDAYSAYAMGKVEEGRSVLRRAEMNAAFWDTLYLGAVAVRDAPGNAVAAVGRGALSFLGSFLSKTWWIIALAALGWLAWSSRGAIAAGAVRRVREAVK